MIAVSRRLALPSLLALGLCACGSGASGPGGSLTAAPAAGTGTTYTFHPVHCFAEHNGVTLAQDDGATVRILTGSEPMGIDRALPPVLVEYAPSPGLTFSLNAGSCSALSGTLTRTGTDATNVAVGGSAHVECVDGAGVAVSGDLTFSGCSPH